ncbi:MAG: ribosomal protein [Bacteroidota bacterium]|nr:ribosomal protein [Bacteroidota bacterium]
MANVVLIKPIVTEKSTKSSDKHRKYAFKVAREANKLEIKKAIEAAYNVKVENVNTQVNVGKMKTRQTKRGISSGVKAAFKKAHVTLKDGETIDFYGSV